jgi:uncharacterized protein (TIGR02246 family)
MEVGMSASDPASARSPEEVIELFSKLIGQGDAESALTLYEEDAAFVPQPGQVVLGREAIRPALQRFARLRPALTGEIEKVVAAGDAALVINRWDLHGADPNGDEVRMSGRSADVLRKQADDTWRIVIDDPWGGQQSE